MILSICMMVKDEEKNLDRCLNSLNNLRKNIESELIIIDTGSIDNTVEIAKKYTNKVFFHEWNNNFSEMRNISISYAKGEWIFIIDADEELKNDYGIINFFKNTQNFKTINTGLIKGKDFTKLSNKNSYSEFTSPRIFKNDGEFKYEGKIHNQPIFKESILLIDNSVLYHYGYNSEDKKLMENKFKRTTYLLKKELEINPNDIYYRYQLSVSYRMHKYYEKALCEIEKAYFLVKNESSKETYSYVYKQYIKCKKDFNEEKSAVDLAEEFLKSNTQDIDILFLYTDSLIKLNYYSKAKNYCKKYIDLVNNYKNNKNITVFSLTNQIETIQFKQKIYSDLIEILFKLNEYKEILNYQIYIKENDYIEKTLPFIIYSYLKFEKIDELLIYYKYKINNTNENIEKKFFDEIEKNIFNLENEFANKIYREFSCFNNNYSIFNVIRINYFNDKILLEEIDKLLNKLEFDDLELYYSDLIYYKLKKEINIIKDLSKLEKYKIESIFNYLNEKYEDFKNLILNNIIECEIDDLKELKVQIIIKKFILTNCNLEIQNYANIFTNYVLSGTRYIHNLYNKDIIEKVYDEIEEFEYRFFAIINKAFLEDNKNDCIKYLEKAALEYKDMKKGIDIMKEDVLKR